MQSKPKIKAEYGWSPSTADDTPRRAYAIHLPLYQHIALAQEALRRRTTLSAIAREMICLGMCANGEVVSDHGNEISERKES